MIWDRVDHLFHRAVDAIDAGDLAALQQLLREHPELVRVRLTKPGEWLRARTGKALDGFFHDPYLLWFVAEDPVRRGTLPANIVEIARAIVEAARRENVATLQEQLQFTLRLVAWSGVAAKLGVQIPLIDLLIDAGAEPGAEANNALVNGHIAAAGHLVNRGGTMSLGAALCLDRWDEVRRLYGAANDRQRKMGFVLAALNGKAESLRRMIALGVDVNAPSPDLYAHGTPLHHAVCSGSLDAVRVLVDAGAGVNTPDSAWKGTPLGWAHHYIDEAKDSGRRQRYESIAQYLSKTGARDD